MRSPPLVIRRAVLPAAVFVAVLAVHYVWLGLFPEQDPQQGGWVALPVEKPWARSYEESHSYWLGYSYALSLSFAAAAVRRYLERRACDDEACGPRRLALGSVTFSGFLVVAGCFLIGCCGSPMLVVWMSLFGAGFLPFAKPVVAAVTTLAIGGACWWMGRKNCSVVQDEERVGNFLASSSGKPKTTAATGAANDPGSADEFTSERFRSDSR